jgi:predicted nuclease of restriction endonuclease-like RecB superfamily
MSLTANDLEQIKATVSGVVDPRFAETHQRLDQTNHQIESTKKHFELRFGQLKDDIDTLAAATNRKFHTVFTDVSIMREDLHVVKQMVNEHGFRLARLEQDADIE